MDLSEYLTSDQINVISQSTNSLKLSLTIPETFPYFEGHFPDDPILPASLALEISAWLTSEILLKHEQCIIRKADRCKFSQNIRPLEPLCVDLSVVRDRCFRSRWRRADGTVAVDVRFTLG
jgi:3-hydroxymyristoyl/3-hydroxydecanoyl-(acyl carrier protein) dehydratase